MEQLETTFKSIFILNKGKLKSESNSKRHSSKILLNCLHLKVAENVMQINENNLKQLAYLYCQN